MSTPNETPELTGEEARAGEVRHELRYILFASLLLIVLVFALLFIFWR